MNGAVWDVRNEYLYLTVEVEEEHHRIGTAFLLRDEDTVREAKHKALSSFYEEVLQRLRHLKGDSEDFKSEETGILSGKKGC